MADKIKIALCGFRGHIEKFGKMINSYPESETYAVWDHNYEKAASAAANLGCKVAEDYDALLLDPELDAVVITASNCYHKELVIKAARAGKHIFLEKPLCTDLQDAYEMRDEIEKAGVKFFLTDPFVNASTTYIKDFIASGKLGQLLSVRVRFCNNGYLLRGMTDEKLEEDRRVQGGGMMSDTGGHPLHVVHYLLGKPERIHSSFAYRSSFAKEIGYEEYIAMLMEYPDDLVAIVESGIMASGYTNAVEVCGTMGCIIDYSLGDRTGGVKYRLCQVTEEDIKNNRTREAMNKGDWVILEKDKLPKDPDDHIRYFVRMIAEDIPNEQVGIDPASTHGMNLKAAVELVEMRDAIYKGAASGNGEVVVSG